jgi:hypothetical protein
MFFVFGVIFVVLSRQYQMGTAAKMGPGYFPTILGGLLAVLGLIILVGAFEKHNAELKIERVGWRQLLLLLASIGLFGLLLPKLGLVISIVVLIGVAALASHEFKLRDTVLSIVVLIVMSYVVFVKGLELQFPVWPKFLTGN